MCTQISIALSDVSRQDLTYCYLHMTSARIAALDFFEELEESSSIGKVDEDGELTLRDLTGCSDMRVFRD